MQPAVGHCKYPVTKFGGVDHQLEVTIQVEALNPAVLPVSHTEEALVLSQGHTVGDIEGPRTRLGRTCKITHSCDQWFILVFKKGPMDFELSNFDPLRKLVSLYMYLSISYKGNQNYFF